MNNTYYKVYKKLYIYKSQGFYFYTTQKVKRLRNMIKGLIINNRGSKSITIKKFIKQEIVELKICIDHLKKIKNKLINLCLVKLIE